METYQRCNRCVMDNSSDKTITFDEQGYCNYCSEALKGFNSVYFPDEEGQREIGTMIKQLKEEGKGKKFDCLMGISGGLDSSYLAYLGSKWGLRILAVHIDDGYDAPVAKENIEKLCQAAGIELIMENPDAEQFNDLTKAFILAEVPNLAIPQDNVLAALLYRYARKYGVKSFLSGDNFALECILQQGNTFSKFDTGHIRAIHKQFGTKPMNHLPSISYFQMEWYRYYYKIKTLKPLNYIDYNKERAIKELHDFCGFEYYEQKHLENTLTKVIQLYWFPRKFKVDKRTSHLSSMIVSGQLTREAALGILAKPAYNEEKMEEDIVSVLGQLHITREKFEELVNRPGKQHTDYKTTGYYTFLKRMSQRIKRMRRGLFAGMLHKSLIR